MHVYRILLVLVAGPAAPPTTGGTAQKALNQASINEKSELAAALARACQAVSRHAMTDVRTLYVMSSPLVYYGFRFIYLSRVLIRHSM